MGFVKVVNFCEVAQNQGVNFVNFYDRYVEMCSKAGKSPSRVAMDIGISKSIVTNWKTRGSTPTDFVVHKIAAYFGVTTSDLLGEDTKKEPITIADDRLAELVLLFTGASPERQQIALEILRAAEASRTSQDAASKDK